MRGGSFFTRTWVAWPRVVSVTTALYRRYRPDTFADVVGQEHVTVPLRQALASDKVNHAYLFSGPRGCGKTTSARILARCLNCAEGPTDTPCGKCDSCIQLARGGSGSVDVVEIDAASHNGVDDARELRERAAFAPARDKYKIFILDEAHMVTPQGFNALLKLVEEPPPHVRFIFATTEPEKVISTIRSRTHHYPFRLVPPAILTDYLGKLCEAEGVTVEGGVLPLVVRAGGGSVRDSLSVLDQLMAGSDSGGVTYERAISLLGFTDATLLDDAIGAIAASDGASLFDVIDRVIQTGHEPRRFVEDLLERVRDILVLAASGDAGVKALGEVPEDQLTTMRDHARQLGLERASRAGDLINDALTSMVGATSPRLHLELLAARLLAADGARASAIAAAPRQQAPAPATATPPAPTPAPEPEMPRRREVRAAAEAQAAATPAPPAEREATAEATAEAEEQPKPAAKTAAREPKPEPEPAAAAAPPEPAPAPPAPPAAPAAPAEAASTEPTAPGTSAEDTELVRRRWAEVLGTLERRRVTWVLVSQSAQVAAVTGTEVHLAFASPQLADRFNAGNHAENVSLAVRETLGLQLRAVGTAGPGEPPAAPAPTPAPAATSAPAAPSPPPPAPDDAGESLASKLKSAAKPAAKREQAAASVPDEEDVSADDALADGGNKAGADVVAEMLGGTIVEDD